LLPQNDVKSTNVFKFSDVPSLWKDPHQVTEHS